MFLFNLPKLGLIFYFVISYSNNLNGTLPLWAATKCNRMLFFLDASTPLNYLCCNLTRCLENVKLLVRYTETSVKSNATANMPNKICSHQASTLAAKMTKMHIPSYNERLTKEKRVKRNAERGNKERFSVCAVSVILAQLKYLHNQWSSQSPLWRKEEGNSGFRNSSYTH